MFKLSIPLCVALLAVITSVSGHGYVQDVVIGATHYTGYLPYSDPYWNPTPQRIIRKIPGNGPVSDVTLIDLQCNGYTGGGQVGSAPAPLFATAAAGAQVHLNWTAWPASHVGPMITYMARAPSDITKWNPGTAAVWFKVAQSGKDSNQKWAATDGLNATNGVYTFTIPASLKAGQYIIRHEIIALHSANSYPGAQFYPSCIQIQVTGTGTKLPTSFVSFPGAYKGSDPGVTYNVYGNTAPYTIPGPAVWTG